MSNRVNVTTLRAYINKAKIDNIDFLKIDVEGYDLFVLKGFPWEEIKPIIILAEFEDRKIVPLGYTFYDIAKYLIDKGYYLLVSEWYPVVEYGTVQKWRRFVTYPCELLCEEAHVNIIAVSDLNIFKKLLTLSNKYSTILYKLKNVCKY